MDLKPVDSIIEKHKKKKSALINILHDIQAQYRHLPEMALKRVAARMKMDPVDIYGVATFYRSFTLTPKGKHCLTLCTGTACHVRGGSKIMSELRKEMNIEAGQTTPDGHFSLDQANCLGACAVGPVLVVDGKLSGGMNSLKAKRMVEKLKPNKRKGAGV